jgi:plastocyanin
MRIASGITAFCLAGSAAAATHVVNVGPQATFSPAVLQVAAGDTVRFRNRGGLHNVVADDLSFRCARGCDGTGGNGAPSSEIWFVDVVFSQLGSIGYYCEQHGSPTDGMRGTIVVLPSTPVELQSFEVE